MPRGVVTATRAGRRASVGGGAPRDEGIAPREAPRANRRSIRGVRKFCGVCLADHLFALAVARDAAVHLRGAAIARPARRARADSWDRSACHFSERRVGVTGVVLPIGGSDNAVGVYVPVSRAFVRADRGTRRLDRSYAVLTCCVAAPLGAICVFADSDLLIPA